jgi:hypothetical protein
MQHFRFHILGKEPMILSSAVWELISSKDAYSSLSESKIMFSDVPTHFTGPFSWMFVSVTLVKKSG